MVSGFLFVESKGRFDLPLSGTAPLRVLYLRTMSHIASKKAEFLASLAQTNDIPLMLEVERAEGCHIYDPSGKAYIDLISGIGVSSLGHNNPAVQQAIKDQVDQHMHVMVYGEFVQSSQVAYAEWLIAHLDPSLNSVYFTNSGTEATEGAMKLAKRVTGRGEVLSCFNAYHGSSQGALSVAGGEWLREAYRPLLPGVSHIRYNSFEDLELITEDVACLFIEALQAEGGTIVPAKGYLQAVRERCDATGTMLIFDEIQTGFGRTGKLFAHQRERVVPDILLLGKALGGGMPLGAFVASRERMLSLSHDPVLGHITTFGGHPVSCAAGLAFCQEMERQGGFEKALKLEKVFKDALPNATVNGKGMLLSVELDGFEQVQQLVKYCISHGVITDWFLFNDRSIRVAPPLIISDELLQEAAHVIAKGIEECT